jgi:hypothetical protein
MADGNKAVVFDYRALRLLMGFIALALPFAVSILSSSPLSSISASYYTEGRDAFVGMLFVVSAFLWAYNGHSLKEAYASKIASLAAVFVAIFPTSCDLCKPGIKSFIHYGAAATLFAILAYFCFGPFRKNTKGKGGKKGRRSKIYFTCGCIMVGCMLGLVVTKLTISEETIKSLSVTYWAEAIALCAFGIAWTVAGKYFRPFVDREEALRLFGR